MTPGLAATRQLERKARHPVGPGLGDHLEGIATRRELVHQPPGGPALQPERRERLEITLDAHVQVLQVLAHDHEVEALGPGQRTSTARERAHRPHVGVGGSTPAQMEESGRALAAGGTEEGGVGGVDHTPALGRERLPAGVDGGLAHERVQPFDVEPEGLQDLDARTHRLGRSVLALDHDHASGSHGGPDDTRNSLIPWRSWSPCFRNAARQPRRAAVLATQSRCGAADRTPA
jgi:hypothetical protein